MGKQKEAAATPVMDENAPGSPSTGEDVAATADTPASESTTLAQQPKAALVTRDAGGYAVDEVGTGFEDFTQTDLAVPFLNILQKGNPQVEEGNPAQLPNAKASMLMNSVTQQLYDGKLGVRLIPVHRHRCFIEWVPKDDGGGLVAVYEEDAPEVRAAIAATGRKQVFGKMKINDNNDLQETFNVYSLLVAEGSSDEFVRIVLSMASSQIGPYKKWMTTAQSIQTVGASGRKGTPPMFSHVYRARTEFFKKGENSWYKWNVKFDGPDAPSCRLAEDSVLFQEAKKFRAMVTGGQAKADFASAQQDVVEAEYEM